MSLLLSSGFLVVSTFIYVSRPLSLGSSIMAVSFILTTLLGMTLSSWWGFILFLVYVGALLVLFVYVMAMSPNCFFSRPSVAMMSNYLMMITLAFTLLSFFIFTMVNNSSSNLMFLVSEKPLLLDSYHNISCLVGLSIILLVAMVAVVYLIPGKNQGAPLRPFN
uniref:NADH dehydrogenase subunit 6 n=1 Tax=Phoronopsis harmeri TaxID=490051 RepID=J9PMY5_9BILA|nr:NADH dehydrogenase subunit 6 [Phoronopsis harmeri]AES86303.1 NADH dehydrogenase subunit 6 [Phoronopsis harmeri]